MIRVALHCCLTDSVSGVCCNKCCYQQCHVPPCTGLMTHPSQRYPSCLSMPHPFLPLLLLDASYVRVGWGFGPNLRCGWVEQPLGLNIQEAC
jgi:hypothetical protein